MDQRKPAFLIVLSSIGMGSGVARAATETGLVPASLRPWAAWVLDSDEGKNRNCPAHAGTSTPECAWPARVELKLGEHQGNFRQHWTIFRAGFVPLPGDSEHWPRDLRVDGRAVPTIDHGGQAQILLTPGHHLVTGNFVWDSLPESLVVPPETGLVSLIVLGKPVGFPMRETDGRVFLGKTEEAAEEEKVEVSVYRKLVDTAPQVLLTRVELAVSGKSRELVLARALPEGFEPRRVAGGLPLRFESDGRVRVQARPGQWDIEIVAHRVSAEPSVTRPVPDGLWQQRDEIWVFQAAPNLRAVSVTGVPAIDPAQTLMPAEWKNLPAFALAPGAALTLVEQRRGDSEPAPERLRLERTLWLDADGHGWSAHDRIGGELTRSWRLEASPGTHLGRVAVDASDQFITRNRTDGREGVEIRSTRATIDADSRVERRGTAMPVTGFAHDFDRLATTLNLPVGWDLLHATGADGVSGSWVGRWSLGQLFLLVVLVLVIARLYGLRLGALALVALGLTLVDPRAPAFVWLFAIAGEVAVRVLKPGPMLLGARAARVAIWAVVALGALPIVLYDARFALHPASVTDRQSATYAAFVLPHPEPHVSHDLLSQDRFVAFAAKAPPESIFGRDSAAGDDAADVLGGLDGKAIGEAYGIGGLARVGTGTGGGGLGEGTLGLEGARHKGDQGKMGKRAHAPEKPKEALYALKGPKDNPDPQLAKRLADYDASIVVQTGEGLPRKWWRTATLAFHGPVKSDQQVRLYLVPPWLGRVLAALQAGLLIALALLLIRRPLRLRGGFVPSRPLVAGLTALVLLCPFAARAADYPPDEMLSALKEKLLRQPDCAPDCVAVGDLALDVDPARLAARLQVSTAMVTAIPLPGDLSSWTPTEVRIDGRPAQALARSTDGRLWVTLDVGIHSVALEGPLPARDSIQIPLPLRPHRATFKATGFDLAGIHEDGAVDESISLSRIANPTANQHQPDASAPTLAPFLRIERTLKLGLKWEVETTVTRETSSAAPLAIEIPLLPGESVTTAEIRTEKGREVVSLSFAQGEDSKRWRSTLAERSVIDLRADPRTAGRWSEIWRAQVSPIWHASFAGIPPVRGEPGPSSRVPEWRPWPGEEVHIAVDRPSGVAGRTLTIDASVLDVEPGVRSTQMTLAMELRSSRATDHRILLPPAAEVAGVRCDDVAQPIRQDGQELLLTIPSGKHRFSVIWRQPTGVSTLFRTPAVDLRAPSTNSAVNLKLPDRGRWLLWLVGPATGPVVGMWAVLAVVLVASVLLARTRLTPLRTHHWLLLGLGLTQADPTAALIVVAGFLGLGWRVRSAPNEQRPALYDVGQIALVLLMVLSVYACATVVEHRLWQWPETFLSGNDSVPTQLAWFQDRAESALARPSALSVPLWVYRGLVMAWALWLTVSVVRWSPWVWSCLKRHGLWRPLSKSL